MTALEAPFELAVSREPGATVIVLRGELDMATAPTLEAAALNGAGAPGGLLIVDLSELAFCDSSGLATLLRLHAQLGRDHFALRRADDQVHRVFELAGVEQMLRFV